MIGEFKGHAYQFKFDWASAFHTVERVIRSGVCLVGEKSCAGALLVPFVWNSRKLVAHVIFWQFKSAREMLIFDALIEACAQAGADGILVASHPPAHRIARFYKERGFVESEGNHFLACKAVGTG